MTEALLNSSLIVFAVVMLWTVGNDKRWGWMVGVVSEVVWFVLAVWFWHSWGVVALCVLYGGLYLRNFIKWGQQAQRGQR